MEGRVTIQVSDWDPDGNIDLIGGFTTTFRDFTANLNVEFPLHGRKRFSSLSLLFFLFIFN